MKAIAGIVYRDPHQVNHLVEPMLQVLTHRAQGPVNTHLFANAQIGVCGGRFGHSNSGNVHVALDGHIFNLEDLRAELKRMGHRTPTDSSDVIARAYEVWGSDCIGKLDGDFALAILDQRKGLLLLARDRIGKKPLYWYQDQNYLIFGSDLKALLATGAVPQTPAPDAIAAYLFLGYFPQDITPIEGANKLLPAHLLLFQLQSRRMTISQYWSYSSFFRQDLRDTPLEVSHKLNHLLTRAVERRLPREPNVGCLVSGGLGSASIAYYANKLRRNRIITCFTAGFSGENESDVHAATSVAEELKLAHELEIIPPKYLLDDLIRVIWYLGEPLADPNILATWRMTRLASGVTSTVLSGMGSDEVLAGHSRYIPQEHTQMKPLLARIWQPIALNWIVPLLNRLHQNSALSLLKKARTNPWQAEFLHANALFDAKTLALAAPEIQGLFDATIFLHKFHRLADIPSLVASFLYFDVKTRLPDCDMIQFDRLSAAHGIGWETPFLEKDLVEYLAGLHSMDGKTSHETVNTLKGLLRGHLSDVIIDRPKRTQPAFLHYWANAPQVVQAFDRLLSGTLVDTGYISKDWLKRQLASPESRQRSFQQLWALLVLEVWFRLFINEPIQSLPPQMSLGDLFEK